MEYECRDITSIPTSTFKTLTFFSINTLVNQNVLVARKFMHNKYNVKKEIFKSGLRELFKDCFGWI